MITKPLSRLRERGWGEGKPEPVQISFTRTVHSNVARVSEAHPGCTSGSSQPIRPIRGRRSIDCLVEVLAGPKPRVRCAYPGYKATTRTGSTTASSAAELSKAQKGGDPAGLPRRPRRSIPLLPSGPGGIFDLASRGADGATIETVRPRDARPFTIREAGAMGSSAADASWTGHKLEQVLIVCGDCNVCMHQPTRLPA